MYSFVQNQIPVYNMSLFIKEQINHNETTVLLILFDSRSGSAERQACQYYDSASICHCHPFP